MNKTEMIANVAELSGLSKKDAEKAEAAAEEKPKKAPAKKTAKKSAKADNQPAE